MCQRCKPDLAAYPGLLQPLPILSNDWDEISMDFIEGLPHSFGKRVIIVMVDRLSMHIFFLCLTHIQPLMWYNSSLTTFLNSMICLAQLLVTGTLSSLVQFGVNFFNFKESL